MTCDKLYLVGDIVDLWALRRHWFWPESHNAIVRELIILAESKTQVFYVVGNHDPMLTYVPSLKLGEIQAQSFATHETGTGKKLWIVHGDCVDLRLHYGRWQALIGGGFYYATQWANRLQKKRFRWLAIMANGHCINTSRRICHKRLKSLNASNV